MVNSFEFLKPPPTDNIIKQPLRNTSVNQDFIEYNSREYNIRMNYPSTWLELCRPMTNVIVMFRPIDATLFPDTPDSLSLYILENDARYKNIKDFSKMQIKDFNKDSNVKILNKLYTRLGGLLAFQVILLINGNKFFIITTIKDDKIFKMLYMAKIDNYENYIRNIRQIIDSFEFY